MKLQNFFAIAALAIALSSCTGETCEQNIAAVKFSSIIGNMPETRASDAQWDTGDDIGIFMTTDNGLTSNKKYTTLLGDGNFSAATVDDAIYFPKAGTVDFIAYYPYTSSLVGTIYDVDVSNQSSQENIDLLYSNNATNQKNGNDVELNFTHQLVKVVFNITADSKITSLAGLKTYITLLKTSAEFDLSNGSLTEKGNATTIELKTTISGTTAVAEGIILPTAASARKIVFVVDINNETVTFEWDASTQAFTKGKKNIYTLTLSSDGVEMRTGSQIEDWGTGNTEDNIII